MIGVSGPGVDERGVAVGTGQEIRADGAAARHGVVVVGVQTCVEHRDGQLPAFPNACPP